MPAPRRIVTVLGVLVLLLLVWVLYVGWLALDEGALPPSSALPTAPRDADPLWTATRCGSGGCWRELRLRAAPGIDPDQVVRALGLREEECRRDSWPDPRATCTGADVLPGRVVVVHARYRW
jgi:hypothetical protein